MRQAIKAAVVAVALIGLAHATENAEHNGVDSGTDLTGADATPNVRDIAIAVDKFANAGQGHLRKDEFIVQLEQIRFLLAALAGQEEQFAAQLNLAFKQATRNRTGNYTAAQLTSSAQSCRKTFVQLQDILRPIKSMPGVESRLIGGLYSFMSDSMLFARDESGHELFAVGRSDTQLQRAQALSDEIERESEQLTTLAQLFEHQIKTLEAP